MSEKIQEEIVLVITSADGSEREVIVTHADDSLLLQLSAGETYRFLRRIDSKLLPLEQVIGLRLGDDLNLQFTEDESMVLQDYFTLCTEGECVVEIALESNAEGDLSYFSLPADSVGLELGDGSQLMLAHGDMLTLMELAQGQSAVINAIQQAQGKQLEIGDVLAEAEVAGEETGAATGTSSSLVGLATFAAFGVLAVADLGGGGGGAGGTTPPAPTGALIRGAMAAGPALANTDLWVKAYSADGKELVTAKINDQGGYEFRLPVGYSGPVLLRIVDANGNLPDYTDETSRQAKDLTADLRSVLFVDGTGSTYTANINPATELMVRKLGLAGGDEGTSETSPSGLTAAQIADANREVANALGLAGTDLVADTPKLKVDVAGVDKSDVDNYGKALAAISGGESQTGQTTDKVLEDLEKGIGSDGRKQIRIEGDVGDKIEVKGSGWEAAGSVTVGDTTYAVFNYGDSAQLLIDLDLDLERIGAVL